MAATPKQPADGDQASHAGLPTYDHDKDQDHDQDHDQDRFLVDVRYDLCDAFANLGSSVAQERAEGPSASGSSTGRMIPTLTPSFSSIGSNLATPRRISLHANSMNKTEPFSAVERACPPIWGSKFSSLSGR